MKIQTYYDNKTRDAILTDLLKKTPKARLGQDALHIECFSDYTWCSRYSKYRNLWVCNKKWWGYTEEQIRQLNIQNSNELHQNVRRLLEAKNKWTSGAQTRRANRLEDRVFGQLWEQNRRGRTPGIYTILDRWTTVGAVAATSNDHARQLAEVMYGSIIEKDNVRVGRHGDITEDNLLEAINACEISPAYLEEKKERLKAKYLSDLAELEAKAEKGQYAQLLGLQALEELTEQSAE